MSCLGCHVRNFHEFMNIFVGRVKTRGVGELKLTPTVIPFVSVEVLEFVQKWRSLGFTLVVVIDGSVDMTKLNEWTKRRKRDLGMCCFLPHF